MSLNPLPQHPSGLLGRALGRVDQHDAAALAAAADLDLHLDDGSAAELAVASRGLLGRGRHDAPRRRDAVRPEDVLALMLVQIHGLLGGRSCGRPGVARSQAPMSTVEAPGVKIFSMPAALELRDVVVGDDPAAEHEHVAGAPLAQR